MQIDTKDGRIFKFEGEEPYQRVDGTLTVLRLWSSPCLKCGDLFIVKTPSKVSEFEHSHSFQEMHCQEHKLTTEEINERRIAGRAKSMAAKKKAGRK